MVPKRKKPCQEQEIKVSRITAWGKKKKFIGQKERKVQPRPTLEKNRGIRSQLVKGKLKPSANPAMLQLQECSTQVEPIIKLT